MPVSIQIRRKRRLWRITDDRQDERFDPSSQCFDQNNWQVTKAESSHSERNFCGNLADSGTLSSTRCKSSSYFYELLFHDTDWSQDSSSGTILRASTVPFHDDVAVSPDIRPAARCPRRAVEILGCAWPQLREPPMYRTVWLW